MCYLVSRNLHLGEILQNLVCIPSELHKPLRLQITPLRNFSDYAITEFTRKREPQNAFLLIRAFFSTKQTNEWPMTKANLEMQTTETCKIEFKQKTLDFKYNYQISGAIRNDLMGSYMSRVTIAYHPS